MDSISPPLRSSTEMLSSPAPLDLSSSTEVSQYQNTGTRRPEKSLLQWEVAAPSANMPAYLTNPGNCQIKALFGKINERLGVMKDVAAWKSTHKKATLDLEQERKVLDAAHKMAIGHELIPEMWKAFIQAQMDAAKEIQDHFREQWEKNRAAMPVDFRPIEKSREDIKNISKDILSLTTLCLNSHQVIKDSKSLFMGFITTEHLSETTKQNLFQTLAAVRLAPQMPHVVAP